MNLQHSSVVARCFLESSMGSFIYELPTTGAISFTDFCLDENGLYTTHIVEVTQARANLRGALKEIKRDASGEKDYLKLVKVSPHILRLCDLRAELNNR